MLSGFQVSAQYNYKIKGVNSWGLWGRPSTLEEFGLTTQVHFVDPNPTEGSVKGTAGINILGEATPGTKTAYFQAYLIGYSISQVYLRGKWQNVKQIRKCTGADRYQLSSLTFDIQHTISIEEKILHQFNRTYTLTPPGGSNSVIQVQMDAGGTVLDDVALPHIVTAISPGYTATATFIMPPEILLNMDNISSDCPPPGQSIAEEKASIETEDQPQPRPGMSITESIKAKMPLYAEGNRCISLHHLDGGPQCDDDAIEIRNNCSKLMTVQLALKQATGHYASEIITTLQSGEKKRIQTGCDKSTDGAKFVAIDRRDRVNLLCRPEWYLVGMMDLTGKPYVDVPYEAPKKPVQTAIPGSTPNITFKQERKSQGGSLGDVYFPDQNQTKTYQGSKAKEFQKNMNSTAGFEITDRIFAARYESNGKTIYSVYRFGNQSGYQGKKWFRRWEKGSQEFWNAGWWEREGDYIIVTIYEEYNKRTWAPFKFKIEGESLRQIEEGRNYNPNPLKVDRFYKKYTLNGAPSWVQPAMDRIVNRFPPSN